MISCKQYYLALLLLVTLLTAGCSGTPQSVFYALSPIEGESPVLHSIDSPGDLAIGIGPVTFPAELNRPAIITQSSQNQLTVNEFHRWGGSLENNFIQVVVENMALLMNTDQVMSRPWERYFQPDIRIALDVQRFGGRLGEYAMLNTTWMIFGEGDDPSIIHRSTIKEPVTDSSYDALVAAQSRAIARLCREIADSLKDGLPVK